MEIEQKVRELAKEINLNNGLPMPADQIKRVGNIAIYKDRNSETNYEVIVIHISPEQELNGYFYPEREIYPTPSQWGQYAWTYNSLERALIKFNSLIKYYHESE
jgi:hypothetical protein